MGNQDDFFHALRAGDATNCTKYIDSGMDLCSANSNGQTPLIVATISGTREIVTSLIQKGELNIDHKDDHQKTALIYAVEKNDVDIAKVLLSAGATTIVRDMFGWTPLHIASRKGLISLVRLMTSFNADAIDLDMTGWNSFMYAAFHGHLEIVNEFIKLEIPVDTMGRNGWTPLTCSIIGDHLDIAKALMDAGADTHITDNHGWSLVMLAKVWKRSDILGLLSVKSNFT